MRLLSQMTSSMINGMPTVVFTRALQRHVSAPAESVDADTLKEALDQVFSQRPELKSYVLEEDGSVRKHITIWISGEPIKDRVQLSDCVQPEDEIYVMQALSGG